MWTSTTRRQHSRPGLLYCSFSGSYSRFPWAGGYVGLNLFTAEGVFQSLSQWEAMCSHPSSPLTIDISNA